MKLSRGSEIAVDLLVYCAQRHGEMIKIRDAAAFAKASSDYAHQIASKLVRSGLLESVRGKSGGIRGRNADDVTVGEVIRVMQSRLLPRRASRGNATLGVLLNEAEQSAFDILDAFTIADLVRNRPAHRPACLTCEFRTSFSGWRDSPTHQPEKYG